MTNKSYNIVKARDKNKIEPLVLKSNDQLTRPQDGMWESFRVQGESYVIEYKDKMIGYTVIHEEYGMIQFYVLPEYQIDSETIFKNILEELSVLLGMVGTHNPVFLSTALHFQKSIVVDTYLFSPRKTDTFVKDMGELTKAKESDLIELIPFYQYCINAPEEWLQIYLGDLISRGEIYFLKKDNNYLGACEVRKSSSNPLVADIGMLVSPDYRKAGYGTYLLSYAKKLAITNGRMPICSCECDNLGSRKSIEKAGFISNHRLLKMTF